MSAHQSASRRVFVTKSLEASALPGASPPAHRTPKTFAGLGPNPGILHSQPLRCLLTSSGPHEKDVDAWPWRATRNPGLRIQSHLFPAVPARPTSCAGKTRHRAAPVSVLVCARMASVLMQRPQAPGSHPRASGVSSPCLHFAQQRFCAAPYRGLLPKSAAREISWCRPPRLAGRSVPRCCIPPCPMTLAGQGGTRFCTGPPLYGGCRGAFPLAQPSAPHPCLDGGGAGLRGFRIWNTVRFIPQRKGFPRRTISFNVASCRACCP